MTEKINSELDQKKSLWQRRLDGEGELYHRISQRVILTEDYDKILPGDFALHGFAVDEGVRRNNGRMGAKDAPDIIRKNMAGFPVVHTAFRLLDFGDFYCADNNLENTQQQLAAAVCKVLSKGAKSVVLGGGHELMFAHYSGIKKCFSNKKIGIINIDAHFDNRELKKEVGATSGTGFWQIAQEGQMNSLHIGIQKNSNTLKLFDFASVSKMQYIMADDIYFENLPSVFQKIDLLSEAVDVLYLTICMDVFNVAIAPGVSAQAYNGIFADVCFMRLYKHILQNKKLIALDVAEANPVYDEAERTTRLAAALVNEWFMI